MDDQQTVTDMGGTMPLGQYPCKVKENTLAAGIYKDSKIMERHRHRYEFNNSYLQEFEAAGMIASGRNPDSDLVEIVELKDHPWFVGVQFHPEYKSTVSNPHLLFVNFIKAAVKSSELEA